MCSHQIKSSSFHDIVLQRTKSDLTYYHCAPELDIIIIYHIFVYYPGAIIICVFLFVLEQTEV